ncbi:MAG: hypothetical protein KBG28_16585 [Kofleriaceae bacterium]|nr:hypothetical protein [Kofleriaceae bacterium]
MTWWLAAALLVLGGCSQPAPGPAGPAPPTPAPRLVVRQVAPASARLARLARRLEATNVVGQVAVLVTDALALGPAPLEVVVRECGEPNGFYRPGGEVTICYELVELANAALGRTGDDLTRLDPRARAVLVFITLHELGHAVVDRLALPLGPAPGGDVAAQAERIADEFGLLVMTSPSLTGAPEVLVQPVARYFLHHQGAYVQHASDPHGPSRDRAWAAACVLAGRSGDPVFAAFLGDRLARCPAEVAAMTTRWRRWLAPHRRAGVPLL